MRRWFILLLLSAGLWGCVSPWMGLETMTEPGRTLEIKYELPGTSRDVLYDKTLAWVKATLIPKGGQLLYSDRTKGSISATVMTSYNNMDVLITARYTMRIDFKDGRIRVTCYDFEDFWGEFRKTARPVEDAGFMRQLMQKAKEKGEALNTYLKGGAPSTDAEW